jgi:hypothetical protein
MNDAGIGALCCTQKTFASLAGPGKVPGQYRRGQLSAYILRNPLAHVKAAGVVFCQRGDKCHCRLCQRRHPN